MAFFSFKDKPLSSNSLPNLPKDVSGGKVEDFTPLKTRNAHPSNKIFISIGVVVALILVGVTTFIATQKQPQTTSSKAATFVPPPPGVTNTPTPTAAQTFQISGKIYSSSGVTPPVINGNACTPAGTGLNGVTVSLQQNGTEIQKQVTQDSSIGGSVVPGSYDFTNVATGTYSVCVAVPTGSQMSCPASIGGNASNCFSLTVPPDSTGNVVNLLASTGTISVAPKLTPAPSPTPTTIVVVVATNTPGAAATGHSTSTSSTATPAAQAELPSTGTSLPVIVLAIPFALILVAFVL